MAIFNVSAPTGVASTDTAHIQTALTNAIGTPNSVVILATGTYLIHSRLSIGSNTEFKGVAGSIIKVENSALGTNSSNCLCPDGSPMIHVNAGYAHDISIHDFEYNGNCQNQSRTLGVAHGTTVASAGTGVERIIGFYGGSGGHYITNISVYNMHIHDCWGEALHINLGRNIKCYNNRFENLQHDAVFLLSCSGTGNEIHHNVIEAITDGAIRCDSCQNINIYNNTLRPYRGSNNNGSYKYGANGMQIANNPNHAELTNNINVYNNTFTDIDLTGIWINDQKRTAGTTKQNVHIYNNTFTNCGATGNSGIDREGAIYFGPWGNGVTIEYNTFNGSHPIAILIMSSITTAMATVQINNNNFINTAGKGTSGSTVTAGAVGYAIYNKIGTKVTANITSNYFSGNLKGLCYFCTSQNTAATANGAYPGSLPVPTLPPAPPPPTPPAPGPGPEPELPPPATPLPLPSVPFIYIPRSRSVKESFSEYFYTDYQVDWTDSYINKYPIRVSAYNPNGPTKTVSQNKPSGMDGINLGLYGFGGVDISLNITVYSVEEAWNVLAAFESRSPAILEPGGLFTGWFLTGTIIKPQGGYDIRKGGTPWSSYDISIVFKSDSPFYKNKVERIRTRHISEDGQQWSSADGILGNFLKNSSFDGWSTQPSNDVFMTGGIELGSYSWELGIDASSAVLYASCHNDGVVKIIDIASKSIIASVTVGTGPIGIAVTPDGSYLYVANSGSDTVSVIDLATNLVTAIINVGSLPYSVVIHPDGSKVYVTNSATNTVSVITTASNTVTATVTIDANPFGICINADGTKVYTANGESNTVSVITTSNNSVASINVGTYPQRVAISPDATTVYVTNYTNNTVSVIATSSNTIIATIDVGDGPMGVRVTPDGARIYVTNYLSQTVTIITASTNAVYATIASGGQPDSIAISDDSSTIYISNRGIGGIFTINNTATYPHNVAPDWWTYETIGQMMSDDTNSETGFSFQIAGDGATPDVGSISQPVACEVGVVYLLDGTGKVSGLTSGQFVVDIYAGGIAVEQLIFDENTDWIKKQAAVKLDQLYSDTCIRVHGIGTCNLGSVFNLDSLNFAKINDVEMSETGTEILTLGKMHTIPDFEVATMALNMVSPPQEAHGNQVSVFNSTNGQTDGDTANTYTATNTEYEDSGSLKITTILPVLSGGGKYRIDQVSCMLATANVAYGGKCRIDVSSASLGTLVYLAEWMSTSLYTSSFTQESADITNVISANEQVSITFRMKATHGSYSAYAKMFGLKYTPITPTLTYGDLPGAQYSFTYEPELLFSSAQTTFNASALQWTATLPAIPGKKIRLDGLSCKLAIKDSASYLASIRLYVQSATKYPTNPSIIFWSSKTVVPTYTSKTVTFTIQTFGVEEAVTLRWYLATSNASHRAYVKEMTVKYTPLTPQTPPAPPAPQLPPEQQPPGNQVSVYNVDDPTTVLQLCDQLLPSCRVIQNGDRTGSFECTLNFADDVYLTVCTSHIRDVYSATDRTVTIGGDAISSGELVFPCYTKNPVTGIPFIQMYVVAGCPTIRISVDGTSWYLVDSNTSTLLVDTVIYRELNNEASLKLRGNTTFYIKISTSWGVDLVMGMYYCYADTINMDAVFPKIYAGQVNKFAALLTGNPVDITIRSRDNNMVV